MKSLSHTDYFPIMTPYPSANDWGQILPPFALGTEWWALF